MKKLLILGSGLEQSIAIQEAKKLGIYVIACDQNKNALGLKYADLPIVTDINNYNDILEIGRSNKIDGIFTHAVEIPHIVAKVANTLSLPGIKPKIAERATNKIERITYLKKNGIPCANFVVINHEDELDSKSGEIGFPLIIKPIDNAGARGVQLVEEKTKIYDAYQEAIKSSKQRRVLLEEVLNGEEISTESVVYNGKIHTFALADRNYDKSEKFKPFFVEDGINYPTNLSVEMQDSILNLVEKTINVLGIDFGAAKGDIIIDNGIPKIIEMASRTSGGWFGAGSIPAATGCNMLKPLIQMAVGNSPDIDALKPTRNLGCAQRYIIPTEEGIVKKISGLNEACNEDGVVMSEFFLPKIGDRISRAKSHADRFGMIICTSNSRSTAIEKCESAISKVKIEIS